ncbi:MAG: GNAT family N-acetyltransferase [Syntrophomonas sp.]|nr:GNAT family N-acetyltransferase [Syntrophomonas sp.]
MEQIAMRLGTHEDFLELATIISSSQAWTCYGIDFAEAMKLFEQMEDSIYVAEINEKLVGFVTIRIDGVGNIGAYIRMIAVDQVLRGNGIGAQLIDYVSGIAAENIPNLFLICSVDNISAQRFYERNGFNRVGIIKDLVSIGHDEIFYRKSLGTLY